MTNIKTAEKVNYETRDYDGIKWIRYDHYEHARATTLTALYEGLEGMKKNFAGDYEWASNYDIALDDAIVLIRTTLSGDASETV